MSNHLGAQGIFKGTVSHAHLEKATGERWRSQAAALGASASLRCAGFPPNIYIYISLSGNAALDKGVFMFEIGNCLGGAYSKQIWRGEAAVHWRSQPGVKGASASLRCSGFPPEK